MTALNQENNDSSVIAENTDVSLSCGAGNKASGRITTSGFFSLPSVSKEKISEIRQQFVEGKNDIDKRLDIAFDRLIESLIARDRVDH